VTHRRSRQHCRDPSLATEARGSSEKAGVGVGVGAGVIPIVFVFFSFTIGTSITLQAKHFSAFLTNT
jgi:hypothetical protein